MTFFDPLIICSVIQPGARATLNEAMLLHEALHGWTQIQDLSLLEDLYGQGGGAKPICQITVYIEDYVLSESPGLDSAANPCP